MAAPKKKPNKPGNKGRQGGAQPGAGRKPWKPNAKQREWVISAARVGTPQNDMAAVIGISDNTLRKAFKKELAETATLANVEIGGVLYRRATGRAKVVKVYEDGREETVEEGRDPDTGALIWWTKTRMGWKDTSRMEHTGKDGGPLELLYNSIDGATRGKLPRDIDKTSG